MNHISTKVLEFIRNKELINEGDTVYLAVSGGADSIAMALILKELSLILKCSLFVVNVEHGIRGEESVEDSLFVRDFAEKNSLPFKMISIDSVSFSKEHGYSVEEGARILRYQKMKEFILENEKKANSNQGKESSCKDKNLIENSSKPIHFSLATAHHAEDSAETLVFNMVRGTGLRGLKGISPKSIIHEIITIRPLLCLTRDEIESYLKERGFSYRHDSTNDDDNISRNFIRHKILPELSNLNENAVNNMMSCSEKIGEVYDYLSETAANILDSSYDRNMRDIAKLKETEAICEKQLDAENRDKPETKKSFTEKASVESLAGGILDIAIIKDSHKALRPYIVAEWLRRNLKSVKDIGSSHIDSIINLSLAAPSSEIKTINLPNRLSVVRKENTLYIEETKKRFYKEICEKADAEEADQALPYLQNSENVDKKPHIILEKEELERSEEPLKIAFDKGFFTFSVSDDFIFQDFPRKNYTKWFDYDNIRGVLCLKYREEGDRIKTIQSSDSIPLRRYFINAKIDKHERDLIPLLSDGNEIMWIVGRRISEKYKVTEKTRRILIVNFLFCED